MIRIVASLLFAFAVIPAQTTTPASAPDELAALAARVDAAHHPRGPVPRITGLTASLALHLLDPKAEQRGQVDLDVKFLEWTKSAGRKPVALVRLQIIEGNTKVVRGRDRDGPWQLVKEEAKDLEGADSAQDLEHFTQHVNLLKQLVRFLAPGDVVRALQNAGPVRNETLVLGRVQIACDSIEGRLADFPLVRRGTDEVPAHAKFWLTKDRGTVAAVDVWPLRDGVRDDTAGERVLLDELFERDGVLVPKRLRHFVRDDAGKWRIDTEAVLDVVTLRPDPALRVEDFDRARK
jgi:hypothetical protein